jgi:hypothetical protein
MILPFPVLLTTQIPHKKKLVHFGLFSLGTFITIIQIIRIQTINSLPNYLDSSMLIMWSMGENNLRITIASIPPLSPLVCNWASKGSEIGEPSGRGRSASYPLGSMKDGRVRLASQNDQCLRGREEGKSMTRTTVKSGTYHRMGGDNSSEEYIVAGNDQEGIMTRTEIRVDEENAYTARGRRDPFKDAKMRMPV